MSDEFSGPIIMRFKPGPKAHEYEDIADEYVIVNNPNCGPMCYGLYHGEWMANVWNERPIVRHLLGEIERLRAALKPFAHQAEIIDDPRNAAEMGASKDFELFRFQASYTALSLGDCRNAREVFGRPVLLNDDGKWMFDVRMSEAPKETT